ncbi:MAG: AIDA repeat-containing protein, partial [Elusimicrobiota bacterium]|nr:AIDA repeat-containing protein [Elusimicrobiota bacterium]
MVIYINGFAKAITEYFAAKKLTNLLASQYSRYFRMTASERPNILLQKNLQIYSLRSIHVTSEMTASERPKDIKVKRKSMERKCMFGKKREGIIVGYKNGWRTVESYASDYNTSGGFGTREKIIIRIANYTRKTAYATAALLMLNITMRGYAQAFTDPVSSATTVTGETVSGGLQEVFGTVENTIVQNNGYQELSKGGISKNTTVNNDGEQWVSGGTANNTTLNKGGDQLVEYDGVANDTIINDGGYQLIDTGGTSYDTIINGYGKQEVGGGGIADRTTVNSYGTQYISNGGTTNNAILNSMSVQVIFSGGSANNTVNNGGLVNALSGSKINNYSGKDGAINMYGDNTLLGNTNLIGGALNIINFGSFHTINIENLQSGNAVINMNV